MAEYGKRLATLMAAWMLMGSLAHGQTGSAPKPEKPKLPEGFGKSFVVPAPAQDQYGNPVMTRDGGKSDAHTGLPFEIWASDPLMEFVLMPTGEFMMGSHTGPEETARRYGESNPDPFKDEHPSHRVRITKAFYMGKYEVTNRQYKRFRPAHDSKHYAGQSLRGDNQPVVTVSWNEAVAFCGWLGQRCGLKARLPTEAEWEYACRAGSQTTYYWGEGQAETGQYANVADRFAKSKWPTWQTLDTEDKFIATAPVGRFKPNSFGFYDMLGNVWEWCSDWHDGKYYASSPSDDPAGPGSGTSRVVRGGSWSNKPGNTRSAARAGHAPAHTANHIGFRVVIELP